MLNSAPLCPPGAFFLLEVAKSIFGDDGVLDDLKCLFFKRD
jgi:hypothetical protein